MADLELRSAIRDRRLVAESHGGSYQSDAELLAAFVHHRDEAAIEVLVWRHGAMVLNLCRRILNDEHQAEDAFQAAFLELVRNAESIGKGQAVSSWLYKVAYRVAQRQRTGLSKEPQSRANVDDFVGRPSPDTLIWRDLRPVLDEEIDRLPEKYRAPIVLCYLQGRTTGEAAEALHCPKGTVLSHLSRAREQLRSRLTRRGVALSAAWLATHLSVNASSAAVPAGLIDATVKSAGQGTAEKTAVEAVSSSISVPAVAPVVLIAKLKLAAAAVFATAALALAGVSIAQWGLLGDAPLFGWARWQSAEEEGAGVGTNEAGDTPTKSSPTIRYE